MIRLALLSLVALSIPSYAAPRSWACRLGDLFLGNQKFSPSDFSAMLRRGIPNVESPTKTRTVFQGDWWADRYVYRLPLTKAGVTAHIDWVQLAGPRYPGDPGNPINVTFSTDSNNYSEFGDWVYRLFDGYPIMRRFPGATPKSDEWKLRGSHWHGLHSKNPAYFLSVPADRKSARKLSQLLKKITDPSLSPLPSARDLPADQSKTVETAPRTDSRPEKVTDPVVIRGGKPYPLFGVLPSSMHRLVTDHPETIPVAPALAPFGEFVFKSTPYRIVSTTSPTVEGLKLEIDPAKLTYDKHEISYEAVDSERHGIITEVVVIYYPEGRSNDGDSSYHVSVRIPRGLETDAQNIERELKDLVIETGLHDKVTVKPTRLVGRIPEEILDEIGLEINVGRIPHDAVNTPLLLSRIRAWLKEKETE